MPPVIAGRFVIERAAGTGGMATVYRARDLATGQMVALKCLSGSAAQDAERFAEEAMILADLVHPAIVRYVAHGIAPKWTTGDPADRQPAGPYLAMEWLEGEDLGARLALGALPAGEWISALRRVADALALAHARGVIHRDLKPANLFLPDRQLDRIKLLDFGIARWPTAARDSEGTGHIIGTPGYLAPEVIGGRGEATARSDVFALGCVMFQGFSGKAPFDADDVGAILTKVLTVDPPRVDALVPELPPMLGDLVAAMLARAPEARPANAREVARALEAIVVPETTATSNYRRDGSPSLTAGEQRIISVVAARLASGSGLDGSTERDLVSAGGEVHAAADGGLVISLPQARKTSDQAMGAARIALLLRVAHPDAAIALGTGPGHLSAGRPAGGVMESVSHLLAATSPGTIHVDAVSATLLEENFEIHPGAVASLLRPSRAGFERRRNLLGRTSTFVGRARELGLLTSTFHAAATERVARAVLVVAEAGAGKSRLRQELLDWVAARPEPVEVLLAMGDSVGTGSPFALLGQALRRAADIDDAEPGAERQRKLGRRVARHLPAEDAPRVLAFLGELAGVPFPDAHDPVLRAARQDPQLMGDHLRRAWQDWLIAECRAHPMLLVLDDLQWSDAGTVSLIDAALRGAHDLPLMVLASARPEVEKAFPHLWAERRLQIMRLDPLSRAAAEALVRGALGADLGDTTVARLLERANGNPFYLEELIRATHEGRHGALPSSVLGMVQARLDAEPVDARRVLRAASILGETFSIEGVSALLGGAERHEEVAGWLEHLAARELVRPAGGPGPRTRADRDRQGDGCAENRDSSANWNLFTQALIREAAYAMLTPDDRVLGHRLAGRWLAQTAFPDPMVVAEHLRRGEQPDQAVGWYERAAVRALTANDLAAAIERAGAGLEALASIAAKDPRDNRQVRGRLRLVQAEAYLWRGEHAIAEHASAEAAQALTPGSADWLRAGSHAIVAVGRQGKLDEMDAWVAQVSGVLPDSGARNALTISLAWASIFLVFGGRYEAADELVAAVTDLAGEGEAEVNPQVMALLNQTRAARASTRGDLGACLAWMEAARAEFERAGDERNACTARANVAFVYAELGDPRRAEEVLRAALVSAELMGLADVRAIILHNLGRVVGMTGDLEEAETLEREALGQLERQGEPRLEGLARTYLSTILTAAGRCGEAVDQARHAVATLVALPALRALSLATLASARSAAGEPTLALEAAREAFSTLEALGTLEEGEAEVRLTYAVCLAAEGHTSEARAVIAKARDQLMARAARIGDAVWRERFLRDVPANARTLALANRKPLRG